MQLNPTVVTPLSVARVRVALPSMAQTEINSVKDPTKNCELVLADIAD